jgi:hypothetical protein
MSKHTPGPWNVKNRIGSGWEITAHIKNMDKYKVEGRLPVWVVPSRTIGKLPVGEDEPQQIIGFAPWCQFPPKWWIEMMEANSHLIAAAPELLDALQSMLNLSGAARIGSSFGAYKGLDVQWHLDKVRAAINRAIGEE